MKKQIAFLVVNINNTVIDFSTIPNDEDSCITLSIPLVLLNGIQTTHLMDSLDNKITQGNIVITDEPQAFYGVDCEGVTFKQVVVDVAIN